MTLLPALLLIFGAAVPAAPQSGPSAGTTLPVNRELAVRLADAEAFLAGGRFEAGITLLQETAEADPGVLLATADADLFVGAAAQAIRRLASLPPEWQAQREKIYGARAAEELRAALDPPDLPRLELLARRYAGLAAGAQARLAAAELWLDRGQPARARLLGPQQRLPAVSDGGLPLAEPEAAQRLPAVQDLADARLPFLDSGELQPLWSREFAERPIGDIKVVGHRLALGGGVVYACDGYEVLALEAGSGRELWRYEADPRWGRMESTDRLRDAISPHLLTAPVLAEGVVLAVVHEAEALGRFDSYMRIPIRRLMPARRLVALDARDGRLLWKMSTSWSEGRDDPRDLAAGPPAVAAGRVYLPLYDAVGTIDFSLAALELRSGRILWRRYLASGQLETNLFGNVLIELATPPPLADPERVFVCSHLGSFHALDAATGEALWTRAYPRMEVNPTETGRLSRRLQQIGRNLGASDSERVAWAPVDGDSLYLLGAADGGLLAYWPAVDARNRHLFTLLGLQKDGVWAAGSRLALLRPASSSAPSLHSEPLYEEGGSLLVTRPGVLVRGEVLLPLLYESVERFSPDRLLRGGRVLDFSGERLASGSLQAAPGLLFVERPGGFDAFGSLRSIAGSFQSADIDPAALAELLPVALNLDFSADPEQARRLAAAAAALAARPGFARQESSLRLLAARSWLQAGEAGRAEALLLPLLDGPDRALSEAACGLLLDDPFLHDPLRAGVERGIAEAANWPDRLLPLHDGSAANGAAVAARARALRALAGDRRIPARRSLTDLLLLPDAGGLSVDGQPLREWAGAALRLLLRDPDELAGYEQDGRELLARAACSADALRAFGATAAAQEALAREVQRADLPRAERLLRARWRREHGAPERAWPDLERWFPPAAALPPAPRSLQALGATRARYGAPLLVRTGASGLALAWVPGRPEKTAVQLWSFAAVAKELQAYALTGRGLSGMETVIPTAEGCAVLLRDRIAHFLAQGGQHDLPLPAELADNAQGLALGDGLLALVLNAQPGFLRVAVLDASTGAIYLEEDLPGQPGPRIEMRHEGRWLYVFVENAALADRIDLHFRTPPVKIALAPPMNGIDMPTATMAAGAVHYMLNRNRPVTGWVVCAEPGMAPLQFPFDGQYVRRVRAGPGLAWIAQVPGRAANAEPRSLHWLAPGAREPQQIQLSSPEARLLQLVESEYKRNVDPVPNEALVLAPEADGSTRVEAYRSGAAAAVWSCALPELAFGDLVANQPLPRQAADAWIVPLLLRPTAVREGRLELHVIEPDGRLRAHAAADWAGGSVEQVRVDLLPGALLVRNGDTLTLYGEAP